MSYIVWFKDTSKDDIAIVGGKGANLGEMFNARFPVPPGFAITAQCYQYFTEKTRIRDKILALLSNLNVDDTEKLQQVANEIQKLVIATEVPLDIREEIIENYEALEIPDMKKVKHVIELANIKEFPFVAVRSSATAEDLPQASFAGQQATYLNVKGVEQLIKSVRACWASLFTARAIYYRTKNNFDHAKVLIAVIIQKMVNADKAGVMFSVNPATSNRSEITIEAAFGLGESVVSGSVNPDLYIVDKSSMKVKSIKVSSQDWGYFRDLNTGRSVQRDIPKEKKHMQKLSDGEIAQLAELAVKVESHYGRPQDMEWAIEKDKLFLVQTRAVTTLKDEPAASQTQAQTNTQTSTTATEAAAPANANDKKVLVSGISASPGIASGKVKVVNDMNQLDKVLKGDILVTKMTNPDMVPVMERAAAIVTDDGGITCHAAIVSREMGIPCIVGTETATEVLKDNMEITVDATVGKVYEGIIEAKKESIVMPTTTFAPPEIITGTEVKIIADLPQLAEKNAATGADGVGLVRIEFMIANSGTHPAKYIHENKDEEYIKVLMDGIGAIARAFNGKSVWVRTSDIRTDEYRNLKGGDEEPHEQNPMIGWHAIRRGLDEPRILKAEFTAIKRLHDQGLTNVGIMLPFIIYVEEVRQAKKLLREVGLEPQRDVEFGVMIETPAACWIIEDLCREGIDFISFGTNDLTQLTLGIDRDNQKIAHLFSELHPAVLGEIKMVVETCKKYGVKSSICGQAGSNPRMAEFLVNIGIDSISANADAVHKIREVVAHTEKKLILEAYRKRLGFVRKPEK